MGIKIKRSLVFWLAVFICPSIYAGAYCPAGNAVCMCPEGGSVMGGNYCPDAPVYTSAPPQWGAIAVDPMTLKWHSVIKQYTRKEAKEQVLSQCGSQCEYVTMDSKICQAYAYSSRYELLVSDYSTNLAVFSSGTIHSRAKENALKKCAKEGATDCKILVSACGDHY